MSQRDDQASSYEASLEAVRADLERLRADLVGFDQKSRAAGEVDLADEIATILTARARSAPNEGGSLDTDSAQEFSAEEWEQVKLQALKQIIESTLDLPERHLSYIKDRVAAVTPRHA